MNPGGDVAVEPRRRKVFSIARMRGGKMTKSMWSTPGVSLGDVQHQGRSTVRVVVADEPRVLNRARSYLYGAKLPCQPTTSSGRMADAASATAGPGISRSVRTRCSRSSNAATGVGSHRVRQPVAPIGPGSGGGTGCAVVLDSHGAAVRRATTRNRMNEDHRDFRRARFERAQFGGEAQPPAAARSSSAVGVVNITSFPCR